MRRRWATTGAGAVLAGAIVVGVPTPALANWQPWENLQGIDLISAPAFAPGTMIYARDTSSKLVRTSGSGWEQVPGVEPYENVSVIKGSRGGTTDPTEIYYRGAGLHVRYLDTVRMCHVGAGCWWESYNGDTNGTASSTPAAVTLHPGRVDVFARSTEGRLRHSWRYGSAYEVWAPWEEFDGPAFSEHPAAVSWRSGTRLDVFVRGEDAHLWHKWWTDGVGWSGWEDLGGDIASAPSVISFDDGRLDVFARSAGNTLLHRWWTAGGGWSGSEDLGGDIRHSPAAAKTGHRRIDVLATGGDRKLHRIWWG
ncbi:hypothetical protein [Saccharothrix obliqua]|uniref:hypothetical protein n=1 Tax=Saccharothrix obliqua TaxID=2861747 RepID=UPI001C5FEA5A|nr:hypothetical protein [Saccharothrix obliqua]MBW4717124.1 hypothetical protein [Saccharothrix obliqua]